MAIQKSEAGALHLANKCRDEIRNVLKSGISRSWRYGIFRMIQESSLNGVRYSLSTEASRHARTDRPLVVTPIVRFDPYDYWVSFVIEFRTSRDHKTKINLYDFEHASIVLFRGDPLDQNKTALLRAEWGCLDFYTDHAQPHWHLYPEGREGFQLSRGVFFEVDPQDHPAIQVEEFGGRPAVAFRGEAGQPSPAKDDNELDARYPLLEEVNLAKMHFAMSAEWHHERSNDRISVDEAGLRRWSGRCLSHVISQVEYAFSK